MMSKKAEFLLRLTTVVCVSLAGCRRSAPATPGQVVFVCEHGAAKSLIAAAHFNRLAAERGLAVRALARGADPQDAPSKAASAGLRADGLEPSEAVPTPLTAVDVRGATRLVAFDCETPPMKVMKGLGACWNDVPVVSTDYAAAREAIRAHATALVDELARTATRVSSAED